MSHKHLRTLITLLLLLFQSISSLLTPYVTVSRISPFRNQGQVSKDVPLLTTQHPSTANVNLQRPSLTTNYPTSPSSLHVAYPGRGKVGAESWKKTLMTSLDSFVRATALVLASLAKSTMQSVRKYWWLHPMSLLLIPPYSIIFKGTYACMPDWWSVFEMSHIAASDNAHWIIAPFLGSNAAYALSGMYLLKKFRFVEVSESGSLKFKPTNLSMLGVWLLVAGLMSSVYHSVQALGSHALAESLCYFDHAIAGSATFYFANTCGKPSKMTWILGAMSAVTLVAASPNYALIHSIWHYLSALTATRWALDGYKRIPNLGSNAE